MIAVAGAIVAQIAIAALSLPYLEQTHWTAEAAFVVSLVAGLLAVYCVGMVQVKLGSLHNPEDVREWLVTARIKRRFRCQTGEKSRRRLKKEYIASIPSFSAAMILVSLTQLLNWSLGSLLVGIGIYYDLVFTEELGSLRGINANLAILVTYVIVTTIALLSWYLPNSIKHLETMPKASALLQEWRGHLARTYSTGLDVDIEHDAAPGNAKQSAVAEVTNQATAAEPHVDVARQSVVDALQA